MNYVDEKEAAPVVERRAVPVAHQPIGVALPLSAVVVVALLVWVAILTW